MGIFGWLINACLGDDPTGMDAAYGLGKYNPNVEGQEESALENIKKNNLDGQERRAKASSTKIGEPPSKINWLAAIPFRLSCQVLLRMILTV